jgi:ABC-type nitrate/sulfonate/bicarbonate transport system substrate-binding protein
MINAIARTMRLLAVAGFGLAAAAGAAQSADRQKINIATGADVGFSHMLVAAKKGFFAKYGIDADYRAYDDGVVALDALLTGQSDLGMSSSLGGITRRARGGKLYVAATAFRSGVNVGVVVTDKVKSPKDIEGKSIGFPVGTGGQEYFLAFVEHHKLDLSKIKQVFLPAPESVAALRRDDIAALFIFEPWMERAVKEVPGARVLERGSDGKVFDQTAYMFVGQRLVDNKELGANVMRGLVDAVAWMKDNPEEAAKMGSEAFRVPLEDAKKQLARFNFEISFGPDVRKRMESGVLLLKGIKTIEQGPNLDEFLRPELLKAAYPDRVMQ